MPAVLAWITFGAVMGWALSFIIGTEQSKDTWLDIVLGIFGAVGSGLLYSAHLNSFALDADNSFASLVGATLILIIVGFIRDK